MLLSLHVIHMNTIALYLSEFWTLSQSTVYSGDNSSLISIIYCQGWIILSVLPQYILVMKQLHHHHYTSTSCSEWFYLSLGIVATNHTVYFIEPPSIRPGTLSLVSVNATALQAVVKWSSVLYSNGPVIGYAVQVENSNGHFEFKTYRNSTMIPLTFPFNQVLVEV